MARQQGVDPDLRWQEAVAPLRHDFLVRLIENLRLPAGGRGLDAGCGTGLHTLLLAEAVGPEGQVTGLDLSDTILARAREHAARAGLDARLVFERGDINALPFPDGAFDWTWSLDCVGYLTEDPRPALGELLRVLKPGGRLILLAWSSQQLLPGYPALEARLSVTSAGIAPNTPQRPPRWHFPRLPVLLREMGFEDVASRALLGEIRGPLDETARASLAELLAMRWAGADRELLPEDWALFKRLSEPTSREFLGALPDYLGFYAYTMIQGRKPA